MSSFLTFLLLSSLLSSSLLLHSEALVASSLASHRPATALGSTGSSANGRRRPRPPRERPTKRTPRPKKEAPVPFDGRTLTAAQIPNEDARGMHPETLLDKDNLQCMTKGISFGDEVKHPAWELRSLDDICSGLSKCFNSDQDFRTNLRMAVRRDIFDTTPFYSNLSPKAAEVLLSPDSSLEGSWRKPQTMGKKALRMMQTTKVLKNALGSKAITGDELLHAIGELCGPDPTTHFIDIYGVQDRKINHSWHMDAGMASSQSRTVLWGFPNDNHYDGCGVFSHFLPLTNECIAPASHPRMEPLLFAGNLRDKSSVVRPRYAPGRELMIFRDVDSLHSAPDVTYRMSLMRFM